VSSHLNFIDWGSNFFEKEAMGVRGVLDSRYLANIPIRKQSILIAYIVKSIKNQKGKPSALDLPSSKNDITNIFDL